MAPARHDALRRYLLVIFLFSILGTTAELLLAEHYDDVWKAVPLALFAIALATLGLHAWRPRRGTLRAFRATMILFIASGGLGIYRHYLGKAEFALERDKSLAGLALVREAALKGINPPLLAPGTMIALGLLGLAWTYGTTTKPATGGEA